MLSYLDYAIGAISDVEARPELTELLGRLRGQPVKASDVDRLMREEPAEAGEQAAAERMRAGLTVGDFELEGELGRGGMGVVYLAVLPPDWRPTPWRLPVSSARSRPWLAATTPTWLRCWPPTPRPTSTTRVLGSNGAEK